MRPASETHEKCNLVAATQIELFFSEKTISNRESTFTEKCFPEEEKNIQFASQEYFTINEKKMQEENGSLASG